MAPNDPDYVPRTGTFGKPDDPFAAATCPECHAVVAAGSYYCAVCFACDDLDVAIRQRLAEQRVTATQAATAGAGALAHAVTAVMLIAQGHLTVATLAIALAVAIPALELVGAAMARARPRTVAVTSGIGLLVTVAATVVYLVISPTAFLGPRFSGAIIHVTLIAGLARVVQVGVSLRRMHARR